jgi:ferric-dicitrate binding protein FerR (iron transport regulator)
MAWSAAAAVIVLLGWGLLGRSHKAEGLPKPATAVSSGGEVLAAAGARTRMVLPDGTTVWLNSNSKLLYRQDYNRQSREVELEGEGYFDVVKDVQRPFIVHTSGIDVKVLGTSFAVKCYAQDETIETTLLRGSIEVSRKDKENSPRVILKPNEKLVYNRHPVSPDTMGIARRKIVAATPDIAVNSIPKNVPDSEKVETAWMYNRLVFNGDGFQEVAAKMERWYNVKITFKDERLYRRRFGGTFANESVEDALKALQLTTAFSYSIHGNEIDIDSK